LFVVIYAEDRFLGAHAISLLPEATLWWLAADGPAGASAGLQAHPLVVFKNRPVARPSTAFRRVMGLLVRGERKARERGSPVCSTGDQVHLSDERGCRTAGCERGYLPWQVATRLRKARDRSAADTKGIDAWNNRAFDLNACAAARLRLGSRDCVAVKLLSTQIVRKQAKAIFHLQQRGTLHAASSSTLSNSTNGWLTWQRRS
jgi:hypothetical protein